MILPAFAEEDFGHNHCGLCGATYDSNIAEVRASIPDQTDIAGISTRDDYGKLFVETWEIANDADEVYPDFAWDDNDALQAGVVAPVIASLKAHLPEPPKDILDLGLDIYTNNSNWVFSLYGRNMLDTVKWGGDTQLPSPFGGFGLGGTFSPLAKGRVYGAQVQYSF